MQKCKAENIIQIYILFHVKCAVQLLCNKSTFGFMLLFLKWKWKWAKRLCARVAYGTQWNEQYRCAWVLHVGHIVPSQSGSVNFISSFEWTCIKTRQQTREIVNIMLWYESEEREWILFQLTEWQHGNKKRWKMRLGQRDHGCLRRADALNEMLNVETRI